MVQPRENDVGGLGPASDRWLDMASDLGFICRCKWVCNIIYKVCIYFPDTPCVLFFASTRWFRGSKERHMYFLSHGAFVFVFRSGVWCLV